jgi:hypothetical protein
LKLNVIEQPALGATGKLQDVLVIANGPVIVVRLVSTTSAAVPLLKRMRLPLCGAVPKTWGWNVMFEEPGRNTTGAVPSPVKAVLLGPIGALEAMLSCAPAQPAAVGLKL